MAEVMGTLEVDEFMNEPLVTWFKSNFESFTDRKPTYEELIDGVLIHDAFLRMDLHVEVSDISAPGNDLIVRLRNLKHILNNMRLFYEEELGHIILRSPDISRLAKNPRVHVQEIKLLLCLLLGCAVQCPNNEHFISKIRQLDEGTQVSIADCIAQVVHVPDIVLSVDMLRCNNNVSKDSNLNETDNVQKAFEHIRMIYRERNLYRDKLLNAVRVARLDELGSSRQDVSMILDDDELNSIQELLNCSTRSDREESQKREAELLECKSRVRAQREALKERIEDLQECKDELQECKSQLAKLIKKNERLVSEARNAKSYRDELDAASEKVEKFDRLEQEIARYKEKLSCIDYYKTRLEELQQHNQLLIESKEVLVEQVSSYKAKADKVLDLDQEMFKLKRQLNDLTLEYAASQQKYQEVCEERNQLERLLKENTKEVFENGFILDPDDLSPFIDNTLSDQLTTSAQSETLKLELENRRLSTLVDSLKENCFYESSSKVLDLEKEKKKLSLTVDALKDEMKKLSEKYKELEINCKKALDEKDSFEQRKSQDLNLKYENLERRHAIVVQEKNKLQALIEIKQKRSMDFQRRLNDVDQRLSEQKAMKDAVNETKIKQKDLESKVIALEGEKNEALAELGKQRELLKDKCALLDNATLTIQNLEKKLKILAAHADDSSIDVFKTKNLMNLIDNSYNTIKFNKSPNKTKNEDKVSNLIKDGKEKSKLQNLIGSVEMDNQKGIPKFVNSQLITEILIDNMSSNTREKKSFNQEMSDQLNGDNQSVKQERNLLRAQLKDARIKLRFQNQSIENLESRCKCLEEECKNLKLNKGEYTELKEDFGKLYQANVTLTAEYRKIKTELLNSATAQANYQEKLAAKNEKVVDLEQQIMKFSHRIEILMQINEEYEKDKRSLMENVSHLLEQNHELIKQSLEDKEHYHMEERKNNDNVNKLNRQKEKLEEKIMDLYGGLKSCPARRKNSSTSIVKSTFVKVRRAGSELFNRSRRSWAEETSPAVERSFDFEYTKGEGSDLSLEFTFNDDQVHELTHAARSRKSVN